jgi:hypothetical protein
MLAPPNLVDKLELISQMPRMLKNRISRDQTASDQRKIFQKKQKRGLEMTQTNVPKRAPALPPNSWLNFSPRDMESSAAVVHPIRIVEMHI